MNRLFNNSSFFPKPLITRLLNVKPKFDLGRELKLLNDRKQFSKAIEMFDKHSKNNIERISCSAVTQALKACHHMKDFKRGSLIYSQIPSNIKSDPYILTSLINMYAECDNIRKVETLFNEAKSRTPAMYAAMMNGYVKNGEPKKAIDMFLKIENPNDIHTILLFNACAREMTPEALNLVKKVYKEIPKRFLSNQRVFTSLLDALMKCGDVEYSESLFSSSKHKDQQSYGAMLKGYVKNNMPQKAIDLFHEIKSPDAVNVLLCFNACAQLRSTEALNLVKKLYQQSPERFVSDSRVLSSLLDALMKCGDVKFAESLFRSLKSKDQQPYGAMINGYIENNLPQKAVDLFQEIKMPNEVNVLLYFNACAQLRTNEALGLVKKLHQQLPEKFISNPRVLSSLLNALMKCGDVKCAEWLFSSSKNKSRESYGAMMKGYIENELPDKAIDLFHQIKTPSEVNVLLVFNACAQLRSREALDLVQKLSQDLNDKIITNPSVFTSLLDALMKCGDVNRAESLFHASREKTMHSYGAMLKGYIENNVPEKAVSIFQEMKSANEVIATLFFNACAQLQTSEALHLVQQFVKEMPRSFLSNQYVFVSLLDALIKCNDIEYAESLFQESKEKSPIAYGTMILGFADNENPRKSLSLFNETRTKNVMRNAVTYLGAIKAVSQLCDYATAQWIVDQIPESILTENSIQNSLIDLWGKVGSVNKAKEIFDRMHQPDQFGYTAMVNAYCLNGMGIQAVELFREIPDKLLNEAAYVCVLNACSHSGLVSEARAIFQNIPTKTTNIYCTMIDCLSRASCFTDVQAMIDEYERDHSPDVTIYMAFLSGARNAGDSKLSQSIYDRMEKLFPQAKNAMIAGAVLLANTYAYSGEIHKASKIRSQLVKSGTKKKVGESRTIVDGQIYTFRAHDQSHPRSNEIYAEVEKLSNELLKYGHQYDASWITRPLNQDETIGSVLCGHSERLAIAWNFVVNPNASRIQLSKNLRVCGDCHRCTKLIAAIRQCEIIVRDANRIHHFYKNGQCSCNDYF